MKARWRKGAVTLIHGHPAFGYYYLLKGAFLVENYEKRGDSISNISKRTWLPGENFHD